MKKFILISSILSVTILIIITVTTILFAYSSGYTGGTKKTSSTGCSSCHILNTGITGTITGPDTVIPGSQVLYKITISRSGYSGSHGGVDIAVRLGSLNPNPNSNLLHLSNGELTQSSALNLTNGVDTVSFTYIAPSAPGVDTIWSTVAAGYSNGWNFSPEKKVVVQNPLGIKHESVSSKFILYQNYPNPFNPSTKIKFSTPLNPPLQVESSTEGGTHVQLIVYDILGRVVATLVNEKFKEGTYEIEWPAAGGASSYPSGVYFYKLTVSDQSGGGLYFTETKRMVLLK